MKRIAIVGGGITGLSAAFYLQKEAAENGIPVSVILIEGDPKLGGKLVTDEIDGFVVEGGPDSFITQKPYGLDLCRDLGLEGRLQPCDPRHAHVFILRRDRLLPLPHGFRLTVPTDAAAFLRSPLLSWPAKLRTLAEPWMPARKAGDDESLARFITRRFGRGMLEGIAGPMMAGIYVADPHRLSLLATFPQFAKMEREHGSLTRAMLAMKKKAAQSTRKPPPMFMSLRGGIGELSAALIASVKAEVRTQTLVEELHPPREGGRWRLRLNDGTEIEADAVILTAPAHAAQRLVAPFDTSLASLLDHVRYLSTATVSLGFAGDPSVLPHALDGYGFIVPKPEDSPLLACTWSSRKFENRAPEGHFLIRGFVGGAGREHLAELPENELAELVHGELRRILGLQAPPLFRKVYRWPKANPQYDVGHLQRTDAIEQHVQAAWPGLHLAGSSYRGIGIPDCIHSARQAALQALAISNTPSATECQPSPTASSARAPTSTRHD